MSLSSSVTVLNALPVAKPDDPVFYPYRLFTQENFFNIAVSRDIPLAQVLATGMTLLYRSARARAVTVPRVSTKSRIITRNGSSLPARKS